MKPKMNYSKPFLLFMCILLLVSSVRSPVLSPVTNFNQNDTSRPITSDRSPSQDTIRNTVSAENMSRPVRVAVYDEMDNTTAPTYAYSYSSLGTNASDFAEMIATYDNIEVTMLDVHDIYNHKLITASFDVFVMVDNLPRENITNQVQEFWLGGGGILTLDSAINFLPYFGILPQESAGDNGHSSYWEYKGGNLTITTRHPVSKGYNVDDEINLYFPHSYFKYAAWNWTALANSSAGNDVTKIAKSSVGDPWTSALAYNPSDRGGKVVTIGDSFLRDVPKLHQLLVDACRWLVPVPKGRIVFDLSHQPKLGVDTWDDLAASAGFYSDVRDKLVSNHFTFDKLYPSVEGNLTVDRLASYDILIMVLPDVNLTETEQDAVMTWVSEGGGLWLFGEAPDSVFIQGDDQINQLISPLDMQINLSVTGSGSVTADPDPHPLTENTFGLHMDYRGYINTSSPATPIWVSGVNTLIGAQAYGEGRVVLGADMNWATNSQLNYSSNTQFTENVANWLTSSQASILTMIDTAHSDPNDNEYRGPVARALNQFGLEFHMTVSGSGFNRSLYAQSWDLVIIDNIENILTLYFPDILTYLQGGGKLLLSSWKIGTSTALAEYIGFQVTAEYGETKEVSFWNVDHPIFNKPIAYGAYTMRSDVPYPFGTQAKALETYDNATALAGFTPYRDPELGALVMGAQGRALVNGPLVTLYQNDTDNSAYPDGDELWFNEIAYMLRPTVDNPSDVSYEAGTTGHEIVWTPTSYDPASYMIMRNGSTVTSGTWNGSSINASVDGLDPGTYMFKLNVYDSAGNKATDEVMVTVSDTTTPTVSSPDDLEFFRNTTGNTITWNSSDLYPSHYELLINGSIVATYVWNGSDITVDVDGLSVGEHNITIRIYDTYDNMASDSVTVTVNETPTPEEEPDTPPDQEIGESGIDVKTILLIVAGIAIVALLVLLWKSKSKSKSKSEK